MDTTERAKLPLLAAGQAQKEEWHNESLLRLDLLTSGVVEAELADPPLSQQAGVLYLVAAAGTGAWAGRDGSLAGWTVGGWRFVAPFEGLRLTDRASGVEWRRTGSAWERGRVRAEEVLVAGQKVVGERAAAIASPSGGSVIDAEARACINFILSALRGHGLVET